MSFNKKNLTLVLLLLASSVVAGQDSRPTTRKDGNQPPHKQAPLVSYVILISIDGLRFEDLRNLRLPTLKSLLEQGSAVRNFESVYPAVSRPAHATILSGMFPADHGITSDFEFDEVKGTSSGSKHGSGVQTKTDSLLRAAKRAGVKTLAVNFPFCEGETDLSSARPLDAPRMIRNHRPNLSLVGYDEYAKAIERWGIDSTEAIAAIEAIDKSLQEIVDVLGPAEMIGKTALIVVSSHGFARVENEFFPNTVLARKGYLKFDQDGNPTDWIAATRSSGGSAAIYLKDQQNEEATTAIRKIFVDISAEEGSPIWRVMSKKDGARLGADPRAAFFIDASPGFILSTGKSGKKTTGKIGSSGPRAAAGYLPSRTEMRGFFLASGKAIKSGNQIEYARVIDVAPTIARLLGLDLQAARGRAISAIFVQ